MSLAWRRRSPPPWRLFGGLGGSTPCGGWIAAEVGHAPEGSGGDRSAGCGPAPGALTGTGGAATGIPQGLSTGSHPKARRTSLVTHNRLGPGCLQPALDHVAGRSVLASATVVNGDREVPQAER